MAKILIVDDLSTNREYLVTLLGYFGHQVSEAADGPAGLLLLRDQRPDLAIVDVVLPGMNGYEFVRQVRNDPATAHTSIVFYTSDDDTPEARAAAESCGVRHVLRKPVDPESILRTVNDVLGAVAVVPSTSSLDEFDRNYLDAQFGPFDPGAIVSVVDDNAQDRQEIISILESASFEVAAYSSAEDFLHNGALEHASCLLLDLQMPGMTGLELLELLREKHIDLSAIILTCHGDVAAAVRSMKLGVLDFLEKPVNRRILIAKVHQALREDTARRFKLREEDAVRRKMAKLTCRELELLKLLIRGMSNKQIAAALGISIRTVANHRAHFMEKTGALNAADLVRMSMLAGIGPTDLSSPAARA